MPVFLDRYNIEAPTAEALEDAHHKDLNIQGQYDADFLTYWIPARASCFALPRRSLDSPGLHFVAPAMAVLLS